MTKQSETAIPGLVPRRPFRLNLDMYLTPPVVTYEQAAGDVKLKRLLQRAVNSERAPLYLVNAIRSGISR